MDKYIGWGLYMLVLLVLLFLIFITPVLEFEKNSFAGVLYNGVFPAFCHQKISRSLCLFKTLEGAYYIADCTPQLGIYVPNDNRILASFNNGNLGYKFPVCARDLAIFGAMFLGGIAYLFIRRIDSIDLPSKYILIAALIPIGIDGTVQLISTVGIHLPLIGNYESTNLMRMITGGIIGFAIPFYLLPMLTLFFMSLMKTVRKK